VVGASLLQPVKWHVKPVIPEDKEAAIEVKFQVLVLMIIFKLNYFSLNNIFL
jgi:hypothetical protein